MALPVALTVGLIAFLVTSGDSPSATTSDGRKVTIEKVTFGTHHSFIQGKWWARLLRPIRGKAWAAQHGCYETRFTNNLPALMVWTSWKGLHRLNARLPVEATVLDENDVESELVLSRWNAPPGSLTGGPGPQYGYVAWLFHNFPRRSETMRLRIYDRDIRHGPTQAVEIVFSNANPYRDGKVASKTRGKSLPIERAENGTTFVFQSLQQTSNALWQLNFAAHTNGVSDPSWLVGGMTVSSASGNLLMKRYNLGATSTSNIAFQLPGALWPEEPVWRFAAEFVRIVDFQARDLWTLTNVTIPVRGTPFQFTTNLAAYSDQPLELKLENVARTVPYRPREIRRNANIYVRFEVPDRHLLLLDAKDDQARRIASEVDPGLPRMIYAFGLAIPDGARTVELTFALRRFLLINFDVLSTSLSRTNAAGSIDRSPN